MERQDWLRAAGHTKPDRLNPASTTGRRERPDHQRRYLAPVAQKGLLEARESRQAPQQEYISELSSLLENLRAIEPIMRLFASTDALAHKVNSSIPKNETRAFLFSLRQTSSNGYVYPSRLPDGIGLKYRTCGWPRKRAHGPASSTMQDHAHCPSRRWD